MGVYLHEFNKSSFRQNKCMYNYVQKIQNSYYIRERYWNEHWYCNIDGELRVRNMGRIGWRKSSYHWEGGMHPTLQIVFLLIDLLQTQELIQTINFTPENPQSKRVAAMIYVGLHCVWVAVGASIHIISSKVFNFISPPPPPPRFSFLRHWPLL